jgi:NTP pyrophosphatase (non-canonical NTP hydrolase)
VSLSEAQRRVHDWVSQYEAGYFDPLTNLARLTEEVGELAREINHRFGQKTKKEDEAEGDLAMEMADILFVVICLANREGISSHPRIRALGAYDAYFRVSGVDQLAAEFRERGAVIREGPANRVYDVREIVIEDLNGLVLAFGEPIARRATAEVE